MIAALVPIYGITLASRSRTSPTSPAKPIATAYAAFGVVFGLGILLGPVTGGFLVHFGYGLRQKRRIGKVRVPRVL